MTLIQMEYFAMVARERSFTKAAGKLYVTQQSLSAGIAALGGSWAVSFFSRHVPLELTYAGTELLRHVKQSSPTWRRRGRSCATSARAEGCLAGGHRAYSGAGHPAGRYQ